MRVDQTFPLIYTCIVIQLYSKIIIYELKGTSMQ